MTYRAVACILASALLGCGEEPPAQVEGTVVDRYLDEYTGEELAARPWDLARRRVVAITGEAAEGEVFEGVGRADGSFTIGGLPHGPLWVGVDGTLDGGDAPVARYAWVPGERRLDWGDRYVGRPDVLVPDGPAYLHLEATGLAPWTTQHELRVIVPHARDGLWDLPSSSDPPPGETTLDLLVDQDPGDTWPWREGFLVDGAAGDELWVLQVERGSGYESIERAFVATPVGAEDSLTTLVSGAFAPGEPRTLHVPIADDAFYAAVSERRAEARRAELIVTAVPLAGTATVGRGVPELVRAQWYDDFTGPFSDGQLAYTDPFPAGWARQVSVVMEYQRDATRGVIRVDLPLDEALALDAAIRPHVTPVLDATVAGRNLRFPQADIGLTPLISWRDPPDGTGPVDIVVEVGTPNDPSSLRERAVFRDVPGQALKLPPGILAPGMSARVTITMRRRSGSASFTSDLFTP